MLRVFSIALLTLSVMGCEGMKKGFDEGYCSSFKENFIKSCNDACTKGGRSAADCDTHCKTELPKQSGYADRCLKK